jgi:hypothetical protein
MKSGFLKLSLVVLFTMISTGCGLKYQLNTPAVPDIKYDTGEKKHVVMHIVDQRSDTKFSQGTAGLENVDIKLDNVDDPIMWLSRALLTEFTARGIPLEIATKDPQSASDLVLTVKKYQIVSYRASGFSPYVAYHSFMGELRSGNQTVPVLSYFLYGKVPVWSMTEIQGPCFDMPMSILVKEIASKINRSALHYSVSEGNLKAINERFAVKMKTGAPDAYLSVLELGASNNPAAMESLVRISDSEDSLIRACALSAMGTLGAQNEFELLKKKYVQYSDIDRFMALKSIGDIGTPEAIDFLKKAKQDSQYSNENGFKYCVDLYLEAYETKP